MDGFTSGCFATALRIVQWPKPFLTLAKPLQSGWLFQRKIPSTAPTSRATLQYLQYFYIRSRLKERGEKKRQISGIAHARGKGVTHSGNLIWNKHCHDWLQSVIKKVHWMNTIPRPSFLIAKEVNSAKVAAWLASCSICSLTLDVIVVSAQSWNNC